MLQRPLRRPVLYRTPRRSDGKTVSRSAVIRPSNPETLGDGDSDSDCTLTSDTMIGRLHDENQPEVVRKQFLSKGNVLKGITLAAGPPTPRTESLSAAASSPKSPLFPLQDIDLVELLNQDDRPTFIVDTGDIDNSRQGLLQVAFANTALQSKPFILDAIRGHAAAAGDQSSKVDTTHQGVDFEQFKAWVMDLDGLQDKAGPSTGPGSNPKAATSMTPKPTLSTFASFLWSVSTLRRRFRVVRGATVLSSAPAEETPDKICPLPAEIARPAAISDNDGDSVAKALHIDIRPSALDVEERISPHEPVDTLATFSLNDGENDTNPSFDWTRISPTDDMSPHIRFARSVDWASTPLGPIENWSGDLCIMANLVMGSPHPVALYWGPQLTVIYNEAYTSLAGQKHPQLMGSNYADSWSEIWDTMEPIFHSAWNAGQAVLKEDNRLFVQRHGFLEETFFNWSLVPLVGSDGNVVALYNPAFDNSRRKVNERRMLTLNEVGEKTATAQTVQDFWQAARQGLEYNEYDIPFALFYSVASSFCNCSSTGSDAAESDMSSILSGNTAGLPQVVLEGSLGVAEDHPALSSILDLRTSDEGFAPYMRQAMTASANSVSSYSPNPVILSVENGTLPIELMAGLQVSRGFGDPCRTVVVFPVQHPSAASTPNDNPASMSISGFIVMGTNPRRSYDRHYRLFVHLLARQLTTSLASVVLFEEEIRRGQHAARRAAEDRHELSQQLLIRTQQAMDSEHKFMRMAECTPVGMFVTDANGRIIYCNDMWRELSHYPREKTASPTETSSAADSDSESSWSTWMDSVHQDDRQGLAVVWNHLVENKAIATHEFRFKQCAPSDAGGDEAALPITWVLLRAYPEKDESGNLQSIFGCITDISQQKLAEEFQIQLRKEAVEHNRQHENFIDITSHEMRNPLSAVLQTVDEITSSIGEFQAKVRKGKPTSYTTVFDSILEACSTISLCTNHQKRIVDDVLTLSKLDSWLLPVTPVNVQPVVVVRGTLKMFENELSTHGISCTLRVQPSYQSLVGTGSWVKLDPSRLNQVLINLLMNAIKFTQSSEERSIVVSLGATGRDCDPTQNDIASSVDGLSYFPSRQDRPEQANGPDWGSGEQLYLHISVSDTGRGLSKDEKDIMFQHFLQASPRTHVQYGGSGLGLYISRSLAELQGGQIGVSSMQGCGSTFAFYVKCRKAASTPVGIESGSTDLSLVVEPRLLEGSSAVIAFSSEGPVHDSGFYTPAKTRTALVPRVCSPPVLIDASPAATPIETSMQPGLSRGSALAPATALTSEPPAMYEDTSGGSGPSNNLPPLDVLIVEDNIVNQRVLQRQLDKCGNRTLVANHGGEALDILRQSTYWRDTEESGHFKTTADTSQASLDSPAITDSVATGKNISVVLMDLEMPVMDGMTCARAIRALERSGTLLRHVPIIAVTAYARPEHIESAKAAGIVS